MSASTLVRRAEIVVLHALGRVLNRCAIALATFPFVMLTARKFGSTMRLHFLHFITAHPSSSFVRHLFLCARAPRRNDPRAFQRLSMTVWRSQFGLRKEPPPCARKNAGQPRLAAIRLTSFGVRCSASGRAPRVSSLIALCEPEPSPSSSTRQFGAGRLAVMLAFLARGELMTTRYPQRKLRSFPCSYLQPCFCGL
jgi:hypothetical protein